MSSPIATSAVHHIALTVSDVRSSKPLESFGIAVLAFRVPDNIQLELTALLA